MTSKKTVVVGKQVYLNAKQEEPMVATIEMDQTTGKILAIHEGIRKQQKDYPAADTLFIEVPEDSCIMPGLVDAHVRSRFITRLRYDYTC